MDDEKRFVLIDDAGFAKGFYSDKVGAAPPANAFEISADVWREWVENGRRRRWNGSELETVEPAPPGFVKVYTRKVDMWVRATDAEADALEAALAAAPARMRQAFASAEWLMHDDRPEPPMLPHGNPLWAPLRAAVVAAVGEEAAARLLAPSPGA